MHPILKAATLTRDEHAVIEAMMRVPGAVSQRELMSRMPDAPSQPTMSRVMASLITRGFLLKKGQTRGARFSLTQEARRLSMGSRKCNAIHYDPDRIGGYDPNKTRWLPDAAAARMWDAVEQAGTKRQIVPTSGAKIFDRFLCDFCWASSILAGSRIHQISAKLLVKIREIPKYETTFDTLMVLNHHAAIAALIKEIDGPFPDVGMVQRRHVLMMRDLVDPADLGTLRKSEMHMSATSYRPSTDNMLLAAGLKALLSKATRITDPFESSFFLFAGFSYLQAFEGGNNRIGRLMANDPLLRAALPPFSFVGIDKIAFALGLNAFYETGVTGPLGDVFSTAYKASALGIVPPVPSWPAPQELHLLERERIGKALAHVFKHQLPDMQIADVVVAFFGGLGEADRKSMAEFLSKTAGRASPASAFLYGVKAEDILKRNDANRSL